MPASQAIFAMMRRRVFRAAGVGRAVYNANGKSPPSRCGGGMGAQAALMSAQRY